MEKFDLEKYNSGNYNVCTKDKKHVRIICTDARAVNGCISSEPIVALVSDSDGIEYVERYSITGICSTIASHYDGHLNLMLVKKIWRPEMHEEYWYLSSLMIPCNTLYMARKEDKESFLIGNCFRTKEEALEKSKEIMNILRKEDEDIEFDNCIKTIDDACDTTQDNVKFIDLGLHSNTLWSNKNVGAETIKDNGKYFSFKEAQKQKGVPTKEQFQELIDECTWTWEGTGYKVVGKNGNSIFFPAADFSYDTNAYATGSYGYYWSSSAHSRSYAYYLSFDNVDACIDFNYNDYSLSVRLVK